MRNTKRAAELIKCAVILHNLCILFSDSGDDPLDDADLDIDVRWWDFSIFHIFTPVPRASFILGTFPSL